MPEDFRHIRAVHGVAVTGAGYWVSIQHRRAVIVSNHLQLDKFSKYIFRDLKNPQGLKLEHFKYYSLMEDHEMAFSI